MMKATLYFNYTLRSLLRGGQRTILAIFCVAVGVMAIVALQLVGFMLQNSLTTNARDLNGGDISVTASALPLNKHDLAFFQQLQKSGTISNYTAVISTNGSLTATAPANQSFSIEAVDPADFPLVGQPSFVHPNNGTVANLLTDNQVIVTQNFLDAFQKHVGDTLTVYSKASAGSGQTLHVTIVGVVASAGVFAQANNLLLISQSDYLRTAPASLANYGLVDVTTANQVHTDAAIKAISAHFPLVSTQTATDLLNTEKTSTDLITKFLEITGLLSLLIGGVGIVNTMQVLLSRRKTEIAMLKTSGYRRSDLYALFGLEAGLLGLIGGVLGSAVATGVSYIVRALMQNLGFSVPFVLNPSIILSGVAIGFATALIFGLMPIVQAANVRPLHVIRELETRKASNLALTILLLLILSILFCALAIVILNNDVMLGIEATYGTFVFLLILSLFFGLIVLAVSKLPVPERLNLKQIAFVLIGIIVAALIYQILPVFSLLLLAVALTGLVITLLPRGWKVSVKMALRNLGRRRTRTATTMLALFIGIFGIALVVGVGQDLQVQITTALAQNQPYNIAVTASAQDTRTLHAQLHTLPGLTRSSEAPFIQALPVAINGRPLQNVLPKGSDRQTALAFLSKIEGQDVVHSNLGLTINAGRDLNASDANTNNVIISQMLTSKGWLHLNLRPGDTITYASTDGKTTKTMTIVGVISIKDTAQTFGQILGATSLVKTLASAQSPVNSVFYLKVDPAQVNRALDRIGNIVPNATIEDLTSTATSFTQVLNNVLDMLVAIASLSVIAAVIIIANAVALAMLERKRELGILKSVGYTSGTVLSEVLIENGIVGSVGAFMATLLAAGGVVMLGKEVFNSTTSIEPVVVLSLVIGSALLAMLISLLVAWKSVRVRPLNVLRYE